MKNKQINRIGTKIQDSDVSLPSYPLSCLQRDQKPYGSNIFLNFSSAGPVSAATPPATQSERRTLVVPVQINQDAPPPATPASILKKTSTPGASSRKRLMRELLEALSEPKKDWWRSSPALFSSGDESDDGYTGRMKRKRLPSSPGVSETPSHGSHCEDDLSGIWSSPPTDDDDDGDWEVWDDDDDFKNKP
nr:MAG: ORF3 [Torque teno polar bear virus 16]